MVQTGQNIFDIASKTGNINNLFAFLNDNNLNVDDYLTGGQTVILNAKQNIQDNFINTSLKVNEKVQNYIAKTGQNIFDISAQLFGTIDLLFDYLITNGIDVDSNINSGQLIKYNNFQKGNENFKKFVINNKKIISNGDGTGNITNYQYLETEDNLFIETEDGQNIIIQ